MTKQLAGSMYDVRFAGFQQLLIAALCTVVFAGFIPQRSLAQQINYLDFNAAQATPGQSSTACGSIPGGPAASGVLFCLNYEAGGVDGISYVSDTYPAPIDPNASTDGDSGSTNYALQLTQSAASQASSVWYSTPQNVANGFNRLVYIQNHTFFGILVPPVPALPMDLPLSFKMRWSAGTRSLWRLCRNRLGPDSPWLGRRLPGLRRNRQQHRA